MPIVPAYGPRRIAISPLPNVQVSPDAPPQAFQPGAAPPDLSGVARVVGSLLAQERQRSDQVALLDAENQLGTLERELLYGQQGGVLTQRGKNALQAAETARARWAEGRARIEQGLRGDAQLLAFRRRAISRELDFRTTTERYVRGEIDRYDQDTTTAALAQIENDALTNAADKERLRSAIQTMGAIVRDYGQRRGLPREAIEGEIATRTSAIHQGVIAGLLSRGADQSAQAYYEANREAMTATDRTRMDGALAEGSARGASQREADRIGSEETTLTGALGLARSITDPTVRQMTESRLRQMFQDRDEAERDAASAALKEATGIIERSRRVTAVPPALWTSLGLGERAALRRYAEQLSTGVRPDTDWRRYYTLKSEAADPQSRPSFLKRDLMIERSRLAESEWKELVGLQTAMKADSPKAALEVTAYMTTEQIVTASMRAAGLEPSVSAKGPAGRRAARFRQAVQQQLQTIVDTKGRRATARETQEVVDDLLVEGLVSGSGIFGLFPDRRRAFERSPSERLTAIAGSIPATDRALIEDALTQAGQAVTEAAVVRLYEKRLNSLSTAAP